MIVFAPIFNPAYKLLVLCEKYLGFSFQHVLHEFSFITAIIVPNVHSIPLLLRAVEVTFVIVSVWVMCLARSFNMCLIPHGFYPSSVWEPDNSQPILATISKSSLVYRPIRIRIDASSFLLPAQPRAFVSIFVAVVHFAVSALQVVHPFPLVAVAIIVVVYSIAPLATLNQSFKSLPILEDVHSLKETILDPISEIDVVLDIHVNTQSSSLMVVINLSVVHTSIIILFLDAILILKLREERSQFAHH